MKNGTIAFVGNFNTDQVNASGKRVKGLAAAIQDDYDIAFIGCSDCKGFRELMPTEEGISSAFFPSPTSIKLRLSIKKYLSFTLAALESIPDLKCIVSYGSPVLSSYVSSLQKWSKQHGIVFISDVVDMIFKNGQGGLVDLLKFMDTKTLKQRIVPNSDGIIAISSRIKNYYQEMGCRNVVLIPPISKRGTPLTTLCQHDDAVRIVYAGVPFNRIPNISSSMMKDRLDWSIDLVCGVIEKGIRINFDIYGLTKDEFLFSLPKYDDTLAKFCSIQFHGKTLQNVVEKAIQQADFTILSREKTPVTESGFPTKFSESLCAGTPVLTTDTSDIKEYLIDQSNGIMLDYGTTDENLNKLVDLFIERERINQMKVYCCEHYPFEPEKYGEMMTRLVANS